MRGSGVRKAIEAVPGAVVDDVRVGSAEVALDEDTEPATVVAAVRDAGYDAVATAGRSADAKTPSSNCRGARRVTLTSLRGR